MRLALGIRLGDVGPPRHAAGAWRAQQGQAIPLAQAQSCPAGDGQHVGHPGPGVHDAGGLLPWEQDLHKQRASREDALSRG